MEQIDWGEAIEKNRRWLSTVVRSRLADREAAEDVLQEVALAAVSQANKPSDPTKIAPWLYRVALRKIVNHHRTTGRRKKLIDGAIGVGMGSEISSEETPGEWLMKQESNRQVAEAMRFLHEHDREILLLKYTEGWGYQELADRLGVSVKTIEYRLLKARRALRAKLC